MSARVEVGDEVAIRCRVVDVDHTYDMVLLDVGDHPSDWTFVTPSSRMGRKLGLKKSMVTVHERKLVMPMAAKIEEYATWLGENIDAGTYNAQATSMAKIVVSNLTSLLAGKRLRLTRGHIRGAEET